MKTRKERLIPKGVPRYVRCYDMGAGVSDRYTVCYTGRYRDNGPGSNEFEKGWFQYVGMSAHPFHPQGIGQHGEDERQIDVNKWGFAPAHGEGYSSKLSLGGSYSPASWITYMEGQ